MSMGGDLNVLLCEKLLDASSKGLGYFAEEGTLRMPAEYRLAFRELGLAIGIEGLEMIRRTVEANRGRFSEAHRLEQLMNSLAKRTSIADDIERFWRDERHWKLASWLEHKDINMVMLATCISPDSFLVI